MPVQPRHEMAQDLQALLAALNDTNHAALYRGRHLAPLRRRRRVVSVHQRSRRTKGCQAVEPNGIELWGRHFWPEKVAAIHCGCRGTKLGRRLVQIARPIAKVTPPVWCAQLPSGTHQAAAHHVAAIQFVLLKEYKRPCGCRTQCRRRAPRMVEPGKAHGRQGLALRSHLRRVLSARRNPSAVGKHARVPGCLLACLETGPVPAYSHAGVGWGGRSGAPGPHEPGESPERGFPAGAPWNAPARNFPLLGLRCTAIGFAQGFGVWGCFL